MWISSVEIMGFKSFRERTIVNFEKGLNVIVGQNGSGKSNILWAISLLFDVRPLIQGRNRFLHEGKSSAPRTLSAYVEVIIDNSSGRFPIPSTKVRLKREIGLKVDAFYVNGKSYSKKKYEALLESSLLSNSLIIKQGEVSRYAILSHEERLDALKNFAGMEFYDNKKELIESNLRKCFQTLETLEDSSMILKDLLAEYEKNNKMLKKYRDLEKDVLALRFVIDSCTHQKKHEQLRSISSLDNDLDILEKEYRHLLDKVEVEKEKMALLKLQEVGILEEAKGWKSEYEQELSRKYRLENEIADISKEVMGEKVIIKKSSELEKYKKFLVQGEERMRELQSIISSHDAAKNEVMKRYELKNQRHKEKLGLRVREFESEQDKTIWILTELEDLKSLTNNRESKVITLISDRESLHLKHEDLREKIKELEEKLKALKSVAFTPEIQVLRAKQEKNSLKLTHLTLEILRQQESLSVSEDNLQKINGTFISKPGIREIMQGIDSMKTLCNKLSKSNPGLLKGFHGILVNELIEFEDYYVPISVIAGNRLFYHIVSNTAVAKNLLAMFNHHQLPGAIYFISLDKLTRSRSLLDNYDRANAVPIISHLKIRNSVINSVMQFIFGSWLLVIDHNCFKAYAGQSVNVVSLEGDVRKERGPMSGGYIRCGYDKMSLYRDYVKEKNNISDSKNFIENLLQTRADLMNNTDLLKKEIENYHQKMHLKDNDIQEVESNLTVMRHEINSLDEEIKTCTSHIDASKLEFDKLKQRECLYTSELEGSQSSSPDMGAIQDLKNLRKDNVATQENLVRFLKEESDLKNKLSICRKKLSDIESCLEKDSAYKISLSENISFLKASDKFCKKAAELSILAEEKSVNLVERLKERKDATTSLEEKIRGLEKDLESKKKEQDSRRARRLIILNQISEAERRMAERCVPSKYYLSKYEKMSASSCLRKLNSNSKELDRINSDVNFKASYLKLDFHSKVTRIESQYNSLSSVILNLFEIIYAFNYVKRDMVLTKIRDVSKYFTEIFDFLVKGKGRAEMSIVKNDDEEEVSGIRIETSFLSKGSKIVSDFNILSGGQKTLVALAFLFALQQTDASPIILMDEVDAALDNESRRLLSKWINQRISSYDSTTQVIVTTFQKELLENTDSRLVVEHRSGLSRVRRFN